MINDFLILLKEFLKRDYKKIFLWVFIISLFSGGFIPVFIEIAKDQGLEAMYITLKNPAMIAMVGNTPVNNASDYTTGALYSQMMLMFSVLFTIITSILHVIEYSKKEEEKGFKEMISSFKIGKLSQSLALIIEVIIINLIIIIFTTITMLLFNDPSITLKGIVLFSLSVGTAGIFGASIAYFGGQLMPSSSKTTLFSIGIVGSLFILRGFSDLKLNYFSYLNPLSWCYLTYPFTNNNFLILLPLCFLTISLFLISFYLETKRDLNTSFINEPKKFKKTKKTLLSVKGLFVRLNKGIILSFLISFLILSISYGSIYKDMHTFLDSNSLIKKMFSFDGITIEESFTAIIMMVMSIIVSILPIIIINKIYKEEKEQYLNQILSTKISKENIYFTNINIAIIVSILGIILTSFALGSVALYVMKSSTINFTDFFIAGLNYLPAIFFFIGLSSFFFGFYPKFKNLVYIYLSYCFIINYFNNILNIPSFISKMTIYHYIKPYPLYSFNIKVFIYISFISFVLIILGFLGFKKRDFHNN